jgi:hypothetical protein
VKLLYTSIMDVVRFGRALGFGARQAVKTVTAAVDAATAENPSRKSASRSASAGANAGPASPRPQAQGAADPPHTTSPAAMSKAASIAAHGAAQTVVQARAAKQGLRRGSRRFGPTWRTFVRLWGVLWLEVVGVVFGLFVLFAALGVWHLRGEWHSTAAEHRQLLGALAMLAVFGYFCGSSFVRARRRERRR